MGKKLDTLLCRNFKTEKFESLINLALTRLSILKNQRLVRLSETISDVTELLVLGHHENAYHRVDQVIKDRNSLDVLFFIHGYFTLLLDRVHLFEHNKDCPEELLEAVSGLFFASSRIGELPELHEICKVLISRFGKDLETRCLELRSNCGVNPKMIQKLSTRPQPRDVRMKALKEIAEENNIVLKLEEASTSSEGTSDVSKDKLTIEDGENYGLYDHVKRGNKYKDVADALQATFEAAAHAAEAARAVVEFSQYSPRGPDSSGTNYWENSFNDTEDNKTEQEDEECSSEGVRDMRLESKRPMSDSEDTNSIDDVSVILFKEDLVKLLKEETVFYHNEEEEESEQSVKSNTKDKPSLMNTGHVDHLVHSIKDPSVSKVSSKSPNSVKTRGVRIY